MMELKHANITEAIIKAFFVVYNALGYGFLEKVYANAAFRRYPEHLGTRSPTRPMVDTLTIRSYF